MKVLQTNLFSWPWSNCSLLSFSGFSVFPCGWQCRNTSVTQWDDLVWKIKVTNWGSTELSTPLASIFWATSLPKIELQGITQGPFSHGTFLFTKGQMASWTQAHCARFLMLAPKQILSGWRFQWAIEVLNISSSSPNLYYIIPCTQPIFETWRAEGLKSRRKGQAR